MKTSMVTLMLGFLFAAVVVEAAPADVRFGGGAFDGWDGCVMTGLEGLGGAMVSLSSGLDQVFDFTDTPALADLTISAEDPAGTITNGGTLRLTVPETWACRFDTGAAVSFSGNASGKVGATSYTDGGRTLSIPVTANFITDDTLVVSGLRLADLQLISPDTQSLELDFDGDGGRDAYDNRSLTVRALWPGGSYDGWDCAALAELAELAPVPSGTTFIFR